MKKYAAYAIGAALVDTEITVSDHELASLGVDKGMMTLVDEAQQAALLEQLSDHLIQASHASGGSAGNSMIATALFGAPTFMSCKVADDGDGDIYVRDLEASGVGHSLGDKRGKGTTGKCLVLITPDAERSLNTYLGVSENLSTAEVDEAAIQDSDWVYLEGYLVTSPTGHAAAVKTRVMAEQHGVNTAVSFSDPGMVQFFRDQLTTMIGERVDLVFCNEAEALEWGQTDSLDEACAAINAIARRYVVTLGARGVIVFDGVERITLAAHTVEAVNTNGAGDMFAGAFLYGLARGESYSRAGEFAARAAAEVVKHFGPRLPPAAYGALKDAFFGS